MLIGVVSPSKVLETSPDGEFISGGKNSKGVDSVALGRQGSFFHWGFAASPTYMTDEAKLVFVNALHYISKFDGKRATTKKKIYASRASLEDLYYSLSDEGFSKWQDLLSESRKAREDERKKLEEKQAAGTELTEYEAMMLKAPPMPEYTRFDLVSLPKSLTNRFGESWDRYIKYYRENEPYLHSPDAEDGRGLYLDVDPIVKQFGIPNTDIKLLEHCMQLLEENDPRLKKLVLSVLTRYTEEDFSEASEWQEWLDTYRDYLYFSDVSGFKFLVDFNALPPHLKQQATDLATDESEFDSIVKSIEVPESSDGAPAQFKPVLKRIATADGPRIRLIIKSRIQKGWHLYAFVPESAPYIQTSFETDRLSNLQAVGKWEKSPGHPSLEDPSVLVWEKDAVVWRDYKVTDDGEAVGLKIDIRYQPCDASRCLPPKSVSFELEL